MNDPKDAAEHWAAEVAAIVVDALLEAGLMSHPHAETARAIVAEEIFARLCVGDHPPYDDAIKGKGM